ncbi:transposase (plasmid) [Neorhizobium sp. NCHU2750]|nr:transposase [Neorhizobium sp. NCHU2750]
MLGIKHRSIDRRQFTPDDAYDGNPTYDAVTRHSVDASVVIPPRANVEGRPDSYPSHQRDHYIAAINAGGRMTWQVATGYGKRLLVETAIGRYKSIIGRQPWASSFAAQRTEAALGCVVLNRMLAYARRKSVRSKTVTVYSWHQRWKFDLSSIDVPAPGNSVKSADGTALAFV